MTRLVRLLLLTLAIAIFSSATIDAKKRKSRKRHHTTTPTEQVVAPPTETANDSTVAKTSKWVNTRNDNTIGVITNVWSDINLQHCLDDFHKLKPLIADSLEGFYQPTLYTLARMMDYSKFHAKGYSPRLTIYFYAAACLFCLMLIVWLVKAFIISPHKK